MIFFKKVNVIFRLAHGGVFLNISFLSVYHNTVNVRLRSHFLEMYYTYVLDI